MESKPVTTHQRSKQLQRRFRLSLLMQIHLGGLFSHAKRQNGHAFHFRWLKLLLEKLCWPDRLNVANYQGKILPWFVHLTLRCLSFQDSRISGAYLDRKSVV